MYWNTSMIRLETVPINDGAITPDFGQLHANYSMIITGKSYICKVSFTQGKLFMAGQIKHFIYLLIPSHYRSQYKQKLSVNEMQCWGVTRYHENRIIQALFSFVFPREIRSKAD